MGKRNYKDACGIARALDVIGERWALLIVRELMFGPKRFADLKRGLVSIGGDVLAQRLRDLEAAGIVQRVEFPPPVSAHAYELTSLGAELEPVLIALGRWGSRLDLPFDLPTLSPDAFMFALKTMFDSSSAALDCSVEFRFPGDRFVAVLEDQHIAISRDAAKPVDVVVESDTTTFARIFWTDMSIAAAEESGTLIVDGGRRLLQRFIKSFASVSGR